MSAFDPKRTSEYSGRTPVNFFHRIYWLLSISGSTNPCTANCYALYLAIRLGESDRSWFVDFNYRPQSMSQNFHESFAGGEVKPPSERATGLVLSAVALIVAVLWRNSPTVLWSTLGIAGTLALVSLLAPALLKPLNMLWFRFGLLLHRVVNPIVMFAVFALVFVPAGAIMRLRHDPLRLRRTRNTSSYWIDRNGSGDTAGSMTNQF